MKMAVLAACVLLLAGTQASAEDPGYGRDASDNVKVAWADVLRVDPIYQSVQTSPPHEVCDDLSGDTRAGNGNRAAGTVLGAIVGGVLGSTVGKGGGRRAATVAGAVVGGAVGNGVARANDDYADQDGQRCHMVQDGPAQRRVAAYDVQYRYRGDVYMSRVNYDPGDRLRVRVSIEPAE